MLKVRKLISLMLAVMLAVSVLAISAVNTGAVETESTKLYFDAGKSGWDVTAKSKVGFYIYSLTTGEDDTLPWGSKKLNGTAVNDGDGNFTGVFSYDPAAKGMNLKDGEQYAIIFTLGDTETYSLLMDTTCYGHIAYADTENKVENPVDSSKLSILAFWEDLNAADYGPRLQISSTGNVIGTCIPAGETGENIFTTFLTATGKEGIENARTYSTKTEQQMIDDIGAGLGLTKDFVQSAFTDNSVETTWSYDASTLPAGSAPDTGYTVSGKITSYLNDSDVTLELAATDSDFSNMIEGKTDYEFINVAAGTYNLTVRKENHVERVYEIIVTDANVTQDVKIQPIGDVTGDGKITTADYGKANSAARKKAVLTGYEFSCADVTGDGSITTADCGKINAAARGKTPLWK